MFDSGASYSFVAASCVNALGLEVETLEEPLHVSSTLRTRVRIDHMGVRDLKDSAHGGPPGDGHIGF